MSFRHLGNLIVSPFDPRSKFLNVLRLNGGAAPDAKTGWSVTVSANVVSYVFLVKEAHELLDLVSLKVQGEANRGVGSRLLVFGEETGPFGLGHPILEDTQVGLRTGDESLETTNLSAPLQTVQVVLNANHGRGINRSTLENAVDELSTLSKTENLRKRDVGSVSFQAFYSTWAENEHAVGTLATKNLLPGVSCDVGLGPINVHSEDSRRGVIKGNTRTVVGDPVKIRHAHTRSSAVEGENDVVIFVNALQVRNLTVPSRNLTHILNLKLLGDVGQPSFSKGFPVEHIYGLGTKH
mmetsp:Transcript_20780/g.42007  ORF Transcript_20780/g.42007 Transcript_20780/m.42007 type:complete len:295 (-) Transcript_20780:370-1254(-)